MVEPEVLAYPAVMMSMYAVAHIGRKQRWEALEWVRMGALATLFGMVIAVQVKRVSLGVITHPIGLLSVVVGLGGMTVLLALYIKERPWSRPLPKLTATLRV